MENQDNSLKSKCQELVSDIMNLFDFSKEKTADEYITIISLGIFLSFTFGASFYIELSIVQIINADYQNSLSELLQPFIFFFVLALFCLTTFLFYKQKKIGWALLNIFFLTNTGTIAIYLLIAIIWLLYVLFSGSVEYFYRFRFDELIYTFFNLIIVLAFTIALFKKTIVNHLHISIITKTIVIGISSILVILWFTFELPGKFTNRSAGLANFLPKNFYKSYANTISVKDYMIPIETENSKVEKLITKAEKLALKHDYDKSILYYNEALKLEPENTSILITLSRTHAVCDDLEDAIIYIDSAISIDSLNPSLYNDRALIRYGQKKFNEAINDYCKAIQVDSAYFTSYFHLVNLYYYLGEYDKSYETVLTAERHGADEQTIKSLKDNYPESVTNKFLK